MANYLQIKCYGAFENRYSLVAILEYAKGRDLFYRLLESRGFSEKIAAHYIKCVPSWTIFGTVLLPILDLKADV